MAIMSKTCVRRQKRPCPAHFPSTMTNAPGLPRTMMNHEKPWWTTENHTQTTTNHEKPRWTTPSDFTQTTMNHEKPRWTTPCLWWIRVVVWWNCGLVLLLTMKFILFYHLSKQHIQLLLVFALCPWAYKHVAATPPSFEGIVECGRFRPMSRWVYDKTYLGHSDWYPGVVVE